MRTHLIIPDIQYKPGVPNDHLYWLGQLIVDVKPDVIINIGDHYDFPSLSLWDKGKKQFEGRRYKEDLKAGHEALEIIEGPLNAYNLLQRGKRKAQYLPEKHLTLGNHEYRAVRAATDSPELSGTVGTEEIKEFWCERNWQVHDFKKTVPIDGVWYCHFQANPMSGNPWGGQIDSRIKNVGNSFTMGHVQTFMYGQRQVGPNIQHGLVAGSFYLHDEEYKGPPCNESVVSGNHHWRGVILKHRVKNGNYDIETISMDRLCTRYTGADSLKEYLLESYPEQRFSMTM